MYRLKFALALVFLLPTTGYAQGRLFAPYVVGAAFDWGSTYLVSPPGSHLLCDRHQAPTDTCRRMSLEANPVINWIHPAKVQAVVAAGADALTVYGLHRLLSKNHPQAFKRGLRVATVARFGLGTWNLYGVKR